MNAPTALGYSAQEPTHAPPWHGLVVWDVFFNALTTGLFLTAAVGELARPDLFAPVARWAYPLALALLLLDLMLLVLDLGDPLRFHHMLRVFKLSSPMSLGTWCLTAYSLPLTALVGLEALAVLGVLAPDTPGLAVVRKALLAAGLPFCFGSMAYKGVLFSTSAQPGWRDARWLGAYHVASALAFGSVILLALASAGGYGGAIDALRPAVAVLVLGQMVPAALLARELRGAFEARYTRGRLRATAALVFGAGGVVPFVLLLLGGAPTLCVAAGALLSGGWAARHAIVLLPARAQHSSNPRTYPQ